MVAHDSISRAVRRPYLTLAGLGQQATFVVRTFASIPLTLRLYPAEVLRLLGDICWGSGAIVVGGGTIGVMVLLALFTGASVGIEGFKALDLLGLAPLTGFVSAYANTREIAPLVAAVAFAAQAGCPLHRAAGRDADLRGGRRSGVDGRAAAALPGHHPGAGRIHRHRPPLHDRAGGNYLATQLVLDWGYGQSPGTYLHYFQEFLVPADIIWSVVKVVVFVVIATLVHCYFGFHAAPTPTGPRAAWKPK